LRRIFFAPATPRTFGENKTGGGVTKEGLMRDNCPRCGSKKVMPDLPLSVNVSTAAGEGGGGADVVILGAPEAWIFKKPVYGGLTVSVCGECGHAELHASNFRRLHQTYEKTRRP